MIWCVRPRGYHDFRGTKDDVYDAPMPRKPYVDPRSGFGWVLDGVFRSRGCPRPAPTPDGGHVHLALLLGSRAARARLYAQYAVLRAHGLKMKAFRHPTYRLVAQPARHSVSFYSLPNGIHR